jgi:arabinose-5-phosphate isomerase
MILDTGRRVLLHEAEALRSLAEGLDETFATAVAWMIGCRGRVITCGVGKSGHIARKSAGTLSSTGTPSLFVHAAEAVHGDLGMVTRDDVVVLFTHSGETDELVRLFPSIREIGARTILVTGRPNSSAGRLADLVLDTGVTEEACRENLAPTTSTTAMLALADALALAAMEDKGFTKEDFARYHPSGTLGRRLLLRVRDVMRPAEEIARVRPSAPILDVIQEMTLAGVGAACVVEDGDRFVGLIGESDIRRHLLKEPEGLPLPASTILNEKAATIEASLMAVEALEVFQNFPIKIGELPVIEEGRVVGLLVLKDLLRSGIV